MITNYSYFLFCTLVLYEKLPPSCFDGASLRSCLVFGRFEGTVVLKYTSFVVDSHYARKNAQDVTSLQTSCYKSVQKLSTSCVRTACSQLL